MDKQKKSIIIIAVIFLIAVIGTYVIASPSKEDKYRISEYDRLKSHSDSREKILTKLQEDTADYNEIKSNLSKTKEELKKAETWFNLTEEEQDKVKKELAERIAKEEAEQKAKEEKEAEDKKKEEAQAIKADSIGNTTLSKALSFFKGSPMKFDLEELGSTKDTYRESGPSSDDLAYVEILGNKEHDTLSRLSVDFYITSDPNEAGMVGVYLLGTVKQFAPFSDYSDWVNDGIIYLTDNQSETVTKETENAIITMELFANDGFIQLTIKPNN